MTLKLRLVFGCCGLLLLARGPLFGAGEYQQAHDGKTMIWNWQPKAGETASWSGGRDKDGYASGFGDLTWYNANGKVFGLFYGNMVHGKFEGPVNVHTGSRVAHSYFVDGERVTSWGRGSAKSTMSASEAALVEKRKAEAEKLAKKEKITRAEPVTTPTPKKVEPEPVPTPIPKKEKAIAKTEPTAPPAERRVRGPDSFHKEHKEKTPAVVEEKSEPLSADEELKRTQPARSTTKAAGDETRTFSEPTPLPKTEASENERPTAAPQPSVEEAPPILHEPATEQKSETTQQRTEAERNPNPSAEKQTPADVSVNSLVGPPSSLRSTSQSSSESTEAQSQPKTEGPLTESEAISLVDNEARVQGAPLDQYERPKVDHSKVKGKWTLFYGLKKSVTGSDLPPSFSATIEDKTRKVEIKK